MMHRVHESTLIAKLTMMRRTELRKRNPDAETIAAMDRTIKHLRRQLSARPQTRQTHWRRRA